jgi:Nucleoside 2-deoxyribosyltransferase
MTLYYVAHRLFAAHDRALGAYVAHRLACRAGADAVFLPFCDTGEEDLVADCKGRRLFEMDEDRLRRIDGMLALLHGPSLDDGLCMEVGYAVARGIPVVVLTTDFQTYGPGHCGPAFAFPDPLLEMLTTRIARSDRLGPSQSSGAADRFEAFLDQNLQALVSATDHAIDALLGAQPCSAPFPRDGAARERLVYLEPSPYLAGGLWHDAADYLRAQGWNVYLARRFRAGGIVSDCARADWDVFTQANLTLVDVCGPETPPGAALMIGACLATGRSVLAADAGGWWTFAEGREPNWRNLMIQYGVSGRFASIPELAALAGSP